jgi:hypothetical protein
VFFAVILLLSYWHSMQAQTEVHTKKSLAAAYNVSYHTLRAWLRPLKPELGDYRGAFTPRQLQIIYSHLGAPDNRKAR